MTTALQKETWEDRIALVRSMCPKALTDTEFEMYLYVCRRYGFDPIMKELIPQKYFNNNEQEYNPVVFVTTHAAYLSIAHRTKMYGGMHSTYDKETKEATAEVWRKDSVHPTVCTIDAGEYNTHKNLWKSKPITMAKKVAEAHALRRAFNINGVYLAEEMAKEIELAGAPATLIPEKTPEGAYQAKPKELGEKTVDAKAEVVDEKAETPPTQTEADKKEDKKADTGNVTNDKLTLIKDVRRIAGDIDKKVKEKIQADLGLMGKMCSEMTEDDLKKLKLKFLDQRNKEKTTKEKPAEPEPPKEPEEPQLKENPTGTCTKCGETGIELKGDFCWNCSEESETPEDPDSMVM